MWQQPLLSLSLQEGHAFTPPVPAHRPGSADDASPVASTKGRGSPAPLCAAAPRGAKSQEEESPAALLHLMPLGRRHTPGQGPAHGKAQFNYSYTR